MSIHSLLYKVNKTRKLPMIMQEEITECGHACVAMISNFWGHYLDLYAIRNIRQPAQQGSTLADLNRLCEDLGFSTRALNVPLEAISAIKCPAILHWNLNHFVVLKAVKRNGVIIHDPATGVRFCSTKTFSSAFTGIVLEIEKGDDFKIIRDKKKLTLLDLLTTAKGAKPLIFCLLLLSLSIEILTLINPLFMQYITDNVLSASNKDNLPVIAIAFMMLCLFQAFTEYIRGNTIIYLTSNLSQQFAANVIRHILHLPIQFFASRHKGDIQSKFQSIDLIQQKISTDFVNTVLDGFLIVLNIMVMLIYSPLLTMVVMLVLLVFLVSRYVSYKALRKNTELSIIEHARTASVFLETIQAILPIKSFLKEKTRFNAWKNSYINSLNADIRISRLNVIYTVLNQTLQNLELIIIVCLGASLVLSQKLSLGMLLAFLSYRMQLVHKASSFIAHVFDYKLISIQLNRLSDILFQEPEIIDGGRGNIDAVKGSLSMKHIAFKHHPDGQNILQNINLEVAAGEKVVIIGSSGCGKTTLLKIAMGLLKPSEGEVLIDNQPIAHFGLLNYRQLTASVMQEDCLLSGSIIDNISFYDEPVNYQRLYEVTHLVHVHEIIEQLPMGYETLIGEMGTGLSGGQKQKILLARALYKQPKLLFLDEATSHLDKDSELKINTALKTQGITQIIVAHRQETIAMADRIIDLQQINQVNNLFKKNSNQPVLLSETVS